MQLEQAVMALQGLAAISNRSKWANNCDRAPVSSSTELTGLHRGKESDDHQGYGCLQTSAKQSRSGSHGPEPEGGLNVHVGQQSRKRHARYIRWTSWLRAETLGV
jgi:hypothetical protein